MADENTESSCSTSNWAAGIGWSCCCCCFIIVIILLIIVFKSSKKGDVATDYLLAKAISGNNKFQGQNGGFLKSLQK